jgi:hypothetical protein
VAQLFGSEIDAEACERPRAADTTSATELDPALAE